MAFIVPKESSNPSSVHENVPYETVSILLAPTMGLLAFIFLQQFCFQHRMVPNGEQNMETKGIIS